VRSCFFCCYLAALGREITCSLVSEVENVLHLGGYYHVAYTFTVLKHFDGVKLGHKAPVVFWLVNGLMLFDEVWVICLLFSCTHC